MWASVKDYTAVYTKTSQKLNAVLISVTFPQSEKLGNSTTG